MGLDRKKKRTRGRGLYIKNLEWGRGSKRKTSGPGKNEGERWERWCLNGSGAAPGPQNVDKWENTAGGNGLALVFLRDARKD